MITKIINLNIGHLLPDTAHDLKKNNIPGLFIQVTTDNDLLITVDTDIIKPDVLASDAITRVYGIPDDLRLCLYYAFDHGCDTLFFNKKTAGNPLLPKYHCNNNEPYKNYLTGVHYNGIFVHGNSWPSDLLPDD